MYDMYPEWGPARNREPVATLTPRQLMQDALDPRDAHGESPDDN